VIDFASLLWFAVYGAAFLMIGLVLRQLARWSSGTSLADAFSGHRDAPWPRGIQEEEPVRWNIQRLRHPAR
jgi:hypothetical protein